MPKKLNPNLSKIHRNYTVEEIAGLYQVHKNTVRAWIANGLQVCDDKKPMLILGRVLREYIRKKNTIHKQKCQLWEFYCVRCRKPQSPALGMADYHAQAESRGRLVALCPSCEGTMNRYSSLEHLRVIEGKVDVSMRTEQPHINKTDNPLLNSDFE
jgi:hypothetical protein